MVEREDFPFALHSLLQHAQLPATDGGQDVVEAVVVEGEGLAADRAAAGERTPVRLA